MKSPRPTSIRTGHTLHPLFGRGPEADQTCTCSRVVRRRGVRMEIWTCTAPEPALRGGRPHLYLFTAEATRERWPGAAAAWYDAWPASWDPEATIPGRTQYVVYAGGRLNAKRRGRAHWRRGGRP